MRELIQRKDDLVAQRATPPYFLKVLSPRPGRAALCIGHAGTLIHSASAHVGQAGHLQGKPLLLDTSYYN